MERIIYEPTKKQTESWAIADGKVRPMPTDDEFKAMWKKAHHGKVTGWGMGKSNWIVSEMKNTSDYQRGIWQGRVDCAQGLPYSEERNEKTYNLGYYRGYTEFENRRTGGWDRAQAAAFEEKYCTKV